MRNVYAWNAFKTYSRRLGKEEVFASCAGSFGSASQNVNKE